ncbi:MAG: hypothetical protein JNL19_02485 [Burkholderiales bacterium]|nr:hypothetical protein [Burkholderiales bacterium]
MVRFGRAAIVALCVAGSAWAAGDEARQTQWRGRWVNYAERFGYAVVDGDIIVGTAAAVAERTGVLRAQLTASPLEHGKALTTDSDLGLWKKAASGVAEVPYVVEAGDAAVIAAAVAEVNRSLQGVLKWVPRGAEIDYVAFNLASPGAGACASAWGRTGGRQTIVGDPVCDASVLIHEMGHAMGLLHVQQDVDTSPFIDTRLSRIPPNWRSQSDQSFYSRTLNGYDYASIMHYGRFGFNAYSDLVTMETKPPGIDIGYPSTFSTADVDALTRLYAAVPQSTTIVTHPAGLALMVDGVRVTTPVTYQWPIGSVHRIWAPDELQTLNGYSLGFARWSHDATANPSPQLTWQVIPGDGTLGAPSDAPMSTVLTANFARLTRVGTSVATQGGALTVTPRGAPWRGSTDLYPQYSAFDLRAVASPGFTSYFTSSGPTYLFGGGQGVKTDTSMLLFPSPATVIGAGFHAGNSIAVDVVSAGQLEGVITTVTAPTGTSSRGTAPRLLRDTAGTWRVMATTPQSISLASRYVVDGIDGLDDSATGTVAMPATGKRTVTIRAHKEWATYRQVVPSCAASIALSDSSSYVRWGSTLTATLSPAPGVAASNFIGWSGIVSGGALTANATVGDVMPEFVATFNSTATPLTLSGLTPPNFGDDAASTVLTLTGTGFTPETRVSINRVLVTPQLVDSGTLKLTLTRSSLPFVGRLPVYVYNPVSIGCPVNSNSIALDVLPAGQKVAQTLTEYYHAGLDYYFLTGRDADKALLDQVPAWARTGKEIKVFAKPNLKTVPLERHFFANVARGGSRGSHFFTALASDQVLMTSLNPANQPLTAKPQLDVKLQ